MWATIANKYIEESALKDGVINEPAIRMATEETKKAKKAEVLIEAAFILSEAGKMISASNHKKLADAINAMKAAMETIAPLIAADADEEIKSESNTLIDQEIDPVLKIAEARYYKWELVKISEAAKILAQSDSYDAKRCAVSSALRKRAISAMIATKVSDGGSLGYEDYYDYGAMPYIRDMYDEQVVYSMGGELYQCDYTVSDDEVTLGDPVEVQVSYVPTSSNTNKENKVEVSGDLILLNEKAVREDGTVQVKLISPGWGSSGHYSEKMLKRDGPKVFKKGLHMYMNHPTEAEDKDRPERDLRDLVGVLQEDAKYNDKGPTGPGLYSTAVVFDNYKGFIDEAAPYIGVSIRAGGRGVEGEAEGRHGLLVDSLEEGYSVDYVTLPGRGGQVLPLLEAFRNKKTDVVTPSGNNNITIVEKTGKVETVMVDISEEELAKLREAAANSTKMATTLEETQTQLARLRERAIITDARRIVTETLSKVNLLDITRTRLIESCMRRLPITDGELDVEAFTKFVNEEATGELKYLETAGINTTNGKVVGMGSTHTPEELTDEAFESEMTEAFTNIGLTEKSAKIAAGSR